MKNLEKYHVTETFDNGDSNVLLLNSDKKESLNCYKSILEQDGYQPEENKSFSIALEKVIFDENGSLISCETIEEQILYQEGEIDRSNYKGESASNYGYTCIWDAKEKQLRFTLFFQGEEQEKTVLESELKNWYYS